MINETYIIAEIGQNHNGDIELAKKLIDLAAIPIFDKYYNRQLKGINAIKLTKRDMEEELTDEEYNRPYDSPHAFGKTYGEHREKLELNYKQHKELIEYARGKGLEVIETLCSPKCVNLTKMAKIDFLKVASRDITNVPLLIELAKTKIPIILSSGMSDLQEILDATQIIEQYHSNISILHCVSQYPADYYNINLNAMVKLKEVFENKYKIGYSDHSIGIMVPIMAVALGAKIIEKHVTLSRSLKGSDHAGSLEMDGLWRMTRDIRNAEMCLGSEEKVVLDVVKGSMKKLRRSLALNRCIKKGEILTEDMLCMLSPGDGMRWNSKDLFLGKPAKFDIPKNVLITKDMF